MKKVALIIGNGDYLHSGRLKNPTNDSRDMKNSLKKLGFEIIYGENLTKKEMNRKLKEFGQIAQGSETALFYYAGHGLQSQGENFLLPIDAEIDYFEDIPEESMSFQRVESEFGNLGASNIFILDACRDNPFEEKMKKQASLQGRNIDFSRGLANPNMHIGNSIIAYSTSPNDIALDSPHEENGVYTKYLKTAILETGLSIESVFKRVAKAVKLETSQSQTPWVHSNSDEDIYLNGKPKEKVIERIVEIEKVKQVVKIIEIEKEDNSLREKSEKDIKAIRKLLDIAIKTKNFDDIEKEKQKIQNIENAIKEQEKRELKKLEKLEKELQSTQDKEITELKQKEENLENSKPITVFKNKTVEQITDSTGNMLIWTGKNNHIVNQMLSKCNIPIAIYSIFPSLKSIKETLFKCLKRMELNRVDLPSFNKTFQFPNLVLPTKEIVRKPISIPNILPKGEFEKSSDFNLRKAKFETVKREQELNYQKSAKLAEIRFLSEKKLAESRYSQEKAIAKERYENEKQEFANEQLQQRKNRLKIIKDFFITYEQELLNKWLSSQDINMDYKADKEEFYVKINSDTKFIIAVPINLAQEFKSKVDNFNIFLNLDKNKIEKISVTFKDVQYFGTNIKSNMLQKKVLKAVPRIFNIIIIPFILQKIDKIVIEPLKLIYKRLIQILIKTLISLTATIFMVFIFWLVHIIF